MRYDEIPGVSENINRCLRLDPSFELVEKLRCISVMINDGLDKCTEQLYKTRNPELSEVQIVYPFSKSKSKLRSISNLRSILRSTSKSKAKSKLKPNSKSK